MVINSVYLIDRTKLERRIRVSLPIPNLHKTNRPHVCLTAVSSLERIPHGDERAWKRLTFGEDRTVRWGQIFTGNQVLAVSGKFLTTLGSIHMELRVHTSWKSLSQVDTLNNSVSYVAKWQTGILEASRYSCVTMSSALGDDPTCWLKLQSLKVCLEHKLFGSHSDLSLTDW